MTYNKEDDFYGNLLGYLILGIVFASMIIVFYMIVHIIYITIAKKETIIYKGPATIISDFYIPSSSTGGYRKNYTPEKHGVILQNNLLKAPLELSYAATQNLKDQKELDVIIVLKEEPGLDFQKEANMYYVIDDVKYKVGNTYKQEKRDY